MVDSAQFTIIFVTLFLFQFLSGSYAATINIVNKCNYKVGPAIFSGAGTSPLSTTGFTLQPGQSSTIFVPHNWSGQIWGRTLCSLNSAGKFSCITGDCSSSTVECIGGKATPPVTLAELTMNGTGGVDFFEVSLVDGFNLPMKLEPHQDGTGSRNCMTAGCLMDLNVACPTELKVLRGGGGVACKSVCQAFGDSQYCCSTGAYGKSHPCKTNVYSEFFKSACPRTLVYYKGRPPSFTCASADYTITFCPASYASSTKPGNRKHPAPAGSEQDNWKGHVDVSSSNLITVAVVIASICGLLACKITIVLSRSDGIRVEAGTGAGAGAETSAS